MKKINGIQNRLSKKKKSQNTSFHAQPQKNDESPEMLNKKHQKTLAPCVIGRHVELTFKAECSVGHLPIEDEEIPGLQENQLPEERKPPKQGGGVGGNPKGKIWKM